LSFIKSKILKYIWLRMSPKERAEHVLCYAGKRIIDGKLTIAKKAAE